MATRRLIAVAVSVTLASMVASAIGISWVQPRMLPAPLLRSDDGRNPESIAEEQMPIQQNQLLKQSDGQQQQQLDGKQQQNSGGQQQQPEKEKEEEEEDKGYVHNIYYRPRKTPTANNGTRPANETTTFRPKSETSTEERFIIRVPLRNCPEGYYRTQDRICRKYYEFVDYEDENIHS